jgi:hypothetical protein
MNDSTGETLRHIGRVRELIGLADYNLLMRAARHDASKLEPPEKEVFDEYTGRLRSSTYGSEEYRGFLAAMKPALDHHYAHNSHHPEHFADGVRGMSLLDVLEMLLDWKAATERHADGCILRSVEANQKRFGYSDELKAILLNTVRELGLAEAT